jgi:nicotinamide-nucleotide amidase
MPERNAKQAWVIPSAEVLPNPVGTAPGWLARVDDTMIVAMPGVPREMVRMWREQALPRISAHLTGRVYRSANLRTLGIGESAVSQLLDELTRRPEPYIGTYAKDDGVHVRVTASGDDPGQAKRDLAETVAEVRRRLGEHVYADDDRSLAHVLLDALRERGLTIGIAESGTGGRFGSTLLSEPSATGVVRGVVAEASDSIAATAGDLARLARERFSADVGVGIVGTVAPSSQGLFEGTIVVAVSGLRETDESFPIRAAYQEIQRRAALNAADVLRRAVGGS